MRWGHRLCRMGWQPQGSCHGSDLHRAVIHAEFVSPNVLLTLTWFWFFLFFHQVTAQFWEKVRGICSPLLCCFSLFVHMCGVTDCPTCSLAPTAAV